MDVCTSEQFIVVRHEKPFYECSLKLRLRDWPLKSFCKLEIQAAYKGELLADPKCLRPLCFCGMIHVQVNRGYIEKNRADRKTSLTSVEQRTGLELDRLQIRGKVRNQPGTLVRRRIKGGLIL